jgi:hypothetical protein
MVLGGNAGGLLGAKTFGRHAFVTSWCQEQGITGEDGEMIRTSSSDGL